MKYTEILKENKLLEKMLNGKRYEIAVISNIITYRLNEILEYTLRKKQINAHVQSGDYDNVIQDSQKFQDADMIIVFWELANLIDGLHFKIDLMNDTDIRDLLKRFKSDIEFLISNLSKSSLVLINKFSALVFNYANRKYNKLDFLCNELNESLRLNLKGNMHMIDVDKVMSQVSVGKSVDFRYYYSSKELYTIDFYKAYSSFIRSFVCSASGKTKKALIFDCDNTLWKGVLGEDGFENIRMSDDSGDGAIFSEIQSLALYLNKKGILLGLCSKNNPSDVDEVLNSHSDMKIRDDQITIKMVNWEDKVLNLKKIAVTLNIGLDSIVFVDDSDFEVNYVREQLPELTVLQVPDKLYKYPGMIRENMWLFENISMTEEDIRKVEMYKHQEQREKAKGKFKNIDDYLKSLGLQLIINIDNVANLERLSQLTQKTNQFNLTTRRYTESNILSFINDEDYKVFDFTVNDKFGSYGITGLAIIKLDLITHSSYIDTFLMSCRVIGRNIEYAFFDEIVAYLKKRGLFSINAVFIRTPKNIQVMDFYDKLGFGMDQNTENEKTYSLNIDSYTKKGATYIHVRKQ